MIFLTCYGCSSQQFAESESPTVNSSAVYIRVNQIGYQPGDRKTAIAFSHEPIKGQFQLVDNESNQLVYEDDIEASTANAWGKFDYYYELDFNTISESGQYQIRIEESGN